MNINRALRLSVRPLRAAYTTRGAAADPHLRSPGRDFTSPPGRRRRSRPPAAPRSVPTSAPRPDLSPEPTPAHRSLAPAQPLSHPRLSPRGPSAHRRLLRQLLSRPLPPATPGAAPPSRQLLLLLPPFPAPPSRSPSRPGAAAPAHSGGGRDALPERCPGSSQAGDGREGGKERLEALAAPSTRRACAVRAREGARGQGAPERPRWRLRAMGRWRIPASCPRRWGGSGASIPPSCSRAMGRRSGASIPPSCPRCRREPGAAAALLLPPRLPAV